MKVTYVCSGEAILKEYLATIGLSKRFCRKVKLCGKMYVNGVEVKNYHLVKIGDIIELEYQETPNESILPLNSKLDILYEDEYFMVINKNKNLSTHPTRKHYEINVVSMVISYFLEKGINSNAHVVNRLDYQTSGLMIVAKSGLTHHKFLGVEIVRKYLAIISGKLSEVCGTIDLPIARCDEHGIKRIVREDGQKATTKYHVRYETDEYSLVEAQLVTGRTHQIRVHFSHLGHPILGDKLYGEENLRLYLHCFWLEFIHPHTNEVIKIVNYCEDFERFYQNCQLEKILN